MLSCGIVALLFWLFAGQHCDFEVGQIMYPKIPTLMFKKLKNNEREKCVVTTWIRYK